MSWTTRLLNLFRRDRLAHEFEEEMADHLVEAIEHGRSEAEARRSLGAALQHREHSRDLKLLPWLDSLASDLIFGWRQLRKHPSASAAAILSLALAIGASTSAFRLVDAVLLRKLPVADPDHLYVLATSYINRDGTPDSRDDFDYPTFRRHAATLVPLADAVLMSGAYRQDVEFTPGQPEKLYREYVSGNAFPVLGLRPTLGRLLTPADNVTPGGHPIAVLSHDCWSRRFARDPSVIGRHFRLGASSYEIIGVGPEGFTGTEPGTITDLFIPAVMNAEALNADGWSWFRIWVRPKAGVTPSQVMQPLNAQLAISLQEQVKRFDAGTPREVIERTLRQSMDLLPASSGASGMQKRYSRPLIILSILVGLVLLIACANVGNLLSAQASTRAREMALRVSIGAGQSRLIQLVLVESALLALIASALGALFSWWSAPFVVSMLEMPENPVRLVLHPDWRVLGFGMALAAGVTLLFGLAPALRASAVKPAEALKSGAAGQSRRALMNTMVAVQVAFCVLVLFVAGLFVSSFERLSTRPLGFAHRNLLIASAKLPEEQSAEVWRQIAEGVHALPGVQSVALAGWAPLSGNHWTGSVRVQGQPIDSRSPYLIDISPGYFETMRIGWIAGRDFRPGDAQPKLTRDNHSVPGVGIVNEAFARKYFEGRNPVGQVVEMRRAKASWAQLEIVGYVRDACYSTVRETVQPTVYLAVENRDGASLLVRTAGDPNTVAGVLRTELRRLRPGLKVGNIIPQTFHVNRQMLRERLLAALSFFFAVIALALAAIGLYGVLNYGVIRQRREIGIRIALGARTAHVVRRIASGALAVVVCGAAGGLAAGMACARFIETLLYEVKPGDSSAIAAPLVVLMIAAILAALPPAIRAAQIDPAQTLRE
jgi:predicted permease